MLTAAEFDRRTDQVYESIPADVLKLHTGELVGINVDFNTSDPSTFSRRVVFGRNMKELQERADIHFGDNKTLGVMYVGTPDGSLPADREKCRALGVYF